MPGCRVKSTQPSPAHAVPRPNTVGIRAQGSTGLGLISSRHGTTVPNTVFYPEQGLLSVGYGKGPGCVRTPRMLFCSLGLNANLVGRTADGVADLASDHPTRYERSVAKPMVASTKSVLTQGKDAVLLNCVSWQRW